MIKLFVGLLVLATLTQVQAQAQEQVEIEVEEIRNPLIDTVLVEAEMIRMECPEEISEMKDAYLVGTFTCAVYNYSNNSLINEVNYALEGFARDSGLELTKRPWEQSEDIVLGTYILESGEILMITFSDDFDMVVMGVTSKDKFTGE